MARNHIAVGALLLLALLGCNPFYSVQQSDVERGYRWIRRGEIENATTTFERAVGSYPQSVLAHTGLADAFFAAHKYGRAIATYSQAISLLRKDEPISKKGPSGDEEIVGMRAFSYQNQGQKFPHGLEAYLYLQRGSALDQSALCEPDRSSEFAPRAMADYDFAIALSPSYAEAISKKNALLRRQEKANQNTGQSPGISFPDACRHFKPDAQHGGQGGGLQAALPGALRFGSSRPLPERSASCNL